MNNLTFDELNYEDGGARLTVKPSANNGLKITYNYYDYTKGEVDVWPESGLRLMRRALNNMAELFPKLFEEPEGTKEKS